MVWGAGSSQGPREPVQMRARQAAAGGGSWQGSPRGLVSWFLCCQENRQNSWHLSGTRTQTRLPSQLNYLHQ